MLPVEKQHYEKASAFDGCSFHAFNGDELPNYPVPMHDLSRDYVPKCTPLPPFSVIYFDRIPIRCCQSLMLQRFMSSWMGSENSRNREDLM